MSHDELINSVGLLLGEHGCILFLREEHDEHVRMVGMAGAQCDDNLADYVRLSCRALELATDHVSFGVAKGGIL